MKPTSSLHNTWKGYLLAAVVAGGITLLKLLLTQVFEYHSPVMLFPVTVLLVTWFFGLGPGLLATALATASATFFFIEPAGQFYIDAGNAQYVGTFLFEALLFCGLVYAVKRYRGELKRSERRASNILESISDVFFSVDREWTVTYINQNAADVMKQRAEEIIGRNLWELFPRVQDHKIGDTLKEAMRSGESTRFEAQGFVSDSWYEISIYPSADGLSAYAKDTTERKHAERRLQASERRLRLALDAARMVAWEWNPETDEVMVSDQFEDVYGLAGVERARQVRDLIHPEDREHHQETIREAAEQDGSYHATFRIIRPDNGKVVWLEEWGYAEQDADGSPTRMVGVALDVTKRKRAEEALRDNEQMLRDILSQLPVGVIMAEPSRGAITYYNEEARRLLKGMMRPAATYDEYEALELYHPDGTRFDVEKLPLMRALRGERTHEVETHCHLPDGSWVMATCSAAPIQNSKGEIARAVLAFSDISERREMERELRRQAHVLNLSHDAILMWPLDDGIQFWNRGAQELYGFTSTEMKGRLTREVLQSKHSVPWEEIERTLREEGMWEGEIVHTSKDGREIVVSSRKQLLEDPDGKPIVLETNRDITDRKRYEQGLEHAKEEAEELARTKTALLANMSHEVRTPLTGLLLLAEMLQKRLSGENRDKVLKIKRGAEKLSNLLDAVLTLSRLEAGHVEIKREAVDVVAEAEQAVVSLRPLAEKKGLGLVLEAPIPAYALADESSLDSILNNLIGNAIKFTDEGRITVGIERREDERLGGDAITISVEDTGQGISPEFQAHVFEEFRQESTGVGRTHEGAGLGLTISKRLVELMNGVIDVESEPGKGSTFSVTLPAASSDRTPLDLGEVIRLGHDGQLPHVLAMDDDELTLELIPELLQDACIVEQASTPEEAIDRAMSEHFDLILLDISMPSDMSGIDVLHALRQHPRYRSVPIIAMTAFALPGDRSRFLKLGFDGYVSKPFRRQDLLSTMRRVLATSDD